MSAHKYRKSAKPSGTQQKLVEIGGLKPRPIISNDRLEDNCDTKKLLHCKSNHL